ncbi:MAG: family 78 glycoside hydrolase catalytic domain, partial [Sedimentisphaerales bacterium]|nr:family 78 glycoside hydrolase catalytic domain [Sedimentisphaerales bacterium]
MDLFPHFRAILCAFLVFSSYISAFADLCPYDLTVGENFVNPVGFYDSTPVFSWKLPSESVSQQGYQLVVASKAELLPGKPDLWDSGIVKSDKSIFIPYDGRQLSSRQKCFWQVRLLDNAGNTTGWSEIAYFELGLLDNSQWQGQWITKRQDQASLKARAASEIKVKKALYGLLGTSEKTVDITAKIATAVAEGRYQFSVNNDYAGSDPAYGTKKEFVIEYELAGKPVKLTGRESQNMDLFTGKEVLDDRCVPQYMRREFSLAKSPVQARLYVTARGIYEMYINGQRVGNDYMAPGYTVYDKRIETLTYDVTNLLSNGDNALAAIVGNGWFGGDIMTRGVVAYPELLVQLEITAADGTKSIVVSDKNWKVTNEGPLCYASNYHGIDYDARKEMPGWNNIGFDDSSWHVVQTKSLDADVALVPKRHNPVRIMKELPTQKIIQNEPGRYIYDLGQNMVGVPRLHIPVVKDATITVRFAEMLNIDGTFYTGNYRNARSTDYYTAATDGQISFMPTLTFHGFRYVELSGLPADFKPELKNVTGVVLYSAFDKTGSFTSSHAKLNKLQENIQWGQIGNFLDVPTDCPQRDERLGWTGDAQVFCPTSMFNYDVLSFWASWTQSIRDDQRADGSIPDFIPITPSWQSTRFTSPGWGDVCVVVPWEVYVRSGNIEILRDNYDTMKKWVAYYNDLADNYLVKHHGYGDWLQPYSSNGSHGDTDSDLIATAYFGRCAMIMADAAQALGIEHDVKYYRELHRSIALAFSNKYFDDNGKVNTKFDTQTAYLMALGYDLLTPDKVDGVISNLLRLINEADGHLRTGFLGTPLFNSVLDELGYRDL